MSLIEAQRAFIAEIAADDETGSSSLGMKIYRGAYRERLAAALAVSFERTRRWIGAAMFDLAAAHYILSNPPQSWTLDAYGADFPAALETLFAQDPEVAELAWLEWHMSQAFAARDLPELTPADLAAADLCETDWERLRFTMAAGFAAREVHHDCTALWHALREVAADGFAVAATKPATLIVWRRELSPHFRVLDCDEFAALGRLAAGQTFGETAALAGEQDIARFGGWFAQWLSEGLFSAVRL